ncbi:unnamed protein product, partial [Rotaria sp. Silwood2]
MTTENILPLMSPVMVNRSNLSAIQNDLVDDKLSSNDICTMFNEFLLEFEQMEKNGETTTNTFLDAVEEIANAVLAILPYKLLDPKVLAHPLIHFLNQMLFDILSNWQASQMRLNIQESDIFLKIVFIFVHAAEHASTTNADADRQRITDLLATRKFLSLVREQIEDCAMHKYGTNDDPNICTLGLLAIKLLQGSPFYYSMERNACLIDALVLNCIDSYDYIQAVYQLQYGTTLTDIDRFVLFTCWEHMPVASLPSQDWMNSLYKPSFVYNIYDELLTGFEHALDRPPPLTFSSVSYIFERYQQLLNVPQLPSVDKHAPNIIDRLIKILQSPSSNNPDDDALIILALETFYNLSKNSDIRAIMKKLHLTSLFKKYTPIEMGKKRKLAFLILAEIMDEQEINNDPSGITSIFIDQLKQLNPNEYNPDVDNTLSSLQEKIIQCKNYFLFFVALMQHEQIKNEFIKQGGLERLITFIRDGDPSKQSAKQQEDALKILWSCTFSNPEALNKLKQDQALMTRVNDILEKSKQDGNSTLEKAAEGLIWKVEKEEKFLEEQAAEREKKKQEKKRKAQESGIEEEDEEEEEESKYDLMISYSWADIDLAHRI